MKRSGSDTSSANIQPTLFAEIPPVDTEVHAPDSDPADPGDGFTAEERARFTSPDHLRDRAARHAATMLEGGLSHLRADTLKEAAKYSSTNARGRELVAQEWAKGMARRRDRGQ